MKVSFGDVKFGEDARKHILEALGSNRISMGEKVQKFEEEWGKIFSYAYSHATSSGTDADIAACLSLYDFGARRGDEIIAPALAFIAVGNSILASGFTPKFVDIKKETLNIDPNKIEEAITPKTRAIMVVHTMGKPCTMDKIMEIAKKHNLYVIEDSCEAHGAKYKGKFVGHWGDMAAFSFYAAHLVCTGEGGMLSTNNQKFSEVIRSIRDHGREGTDFDPKYFNHVRAGLNLRMNEMEASLGLDQIKNFWQVFSKRKENYYYLMSKLSDLKDFIYLVEENKEEETIAPHAFSILLKDPKYNYLKLYKYLREKKINCKRNFGSMPTQHKAFEFLGHKIGDFPESEYVGDNGLHFGIHQFLNKEELDYISSAIHDYFSEFNEE